LDDKKNDADNTYERDCKTYPHATIHCLFPLHFALPSLASNWARFVKDNIAHSRLEHLVNLVKLDRKKPLGILNFLGGHSITMRVCVDRSAGRIPNP